MKNTLSSLPHGPGSDSFWFRWSPGNLSKHMKNHCFLKFSRFRQLRLAVVCLKNIRKTHVFVRFSFFWPLTLAVACIKNLRKTNVFISFLRFWPLTLAVASFRSLKTVFKSDKMAFNNSKLLSTRHSRAPKWPQDGTREPQDGSKHFYGWP